MINADERYLLQQAKFTEREINTQVQKFYNLFRVAPMPQMKEEWVGLTDEEIHRAYNDVLSQPIREQDKTVVFNVCRAIEAKLKEKNGY